MLKRLPALQGAVFPSLRLLQLFHRVGHFIQPIAVEQLDHALVAGRGQLGIDGQPGDVGNLVFLGGLFHLALAEHRESACRNPDR